MFFESCYNIFRNDCTLACQGCSECPGASKPWSQVSRWTMFKWLLATRYKKWHWDRFIKKHSKEFDELFDKFQSKNE